MKTSVTEPERLVRRSGFTLVYSTDIVYCRLTGHNCVICTEPIRGSEYRAPCGDYYDRGCLIRLFTKATEDESLFPPRCCRQNIPFHVVQRFMSAEFLRRFQEKSKEFSTLKRVYCANQACSIFLGPQVESKLKFWFGRQAYRCTAPGCGTLTCSRCKTRLASESASHNCIDDEQDRLVLALGADSGWVRCPGCAQLIELNHGCFHITCRCKTEFCYRCRVIWKRCSCPQWDERRLLTAAEARADVDLQRNRDYGEQPQRAANEQARLERPIQRDHRAVEDQVARIMPQLDIRPTHPPPQNPHTQARLRNPADVWPVRTAQPSLPARVAVPPVQPTQTAQPNVRSGTSAKPTNPYRRTSPGETSRPHHREGTTNAAQHTPPDTRVAQPTKPAWRAGNAPEGSSHGHRHRVQIVEPQGPSVPPKAPVTEHSKQRADTTAAASQRSPRTPAASVALQEPTTSRAGASPRSTDAPTPVVMENASQRSRRNPPSGAPNRGFHVTPTPDAEWMTVELHIRTAHVQEWIERLLHDHDCKHLEWKRYRHDGADVCEMCGQGYTNDLSVSSHAVDLQELT